MFFNVESSIENSTLKILNDLLASSQSTKSSLSLTHLHGFITAIVTAPNAIRFTDWQRILFENNVTFQSKYQEYLIKNLLIQVNNQIVADLAVREEFEPLLFNGVSRIPYKEGPNYLIKEWCRGYFHASQLDQLWIQTEEAMKQLFPFIILGKVHYNKASWNSQKNFFKFEKGKKPIYRENLPTFIKKLYNFWAESRSQYAFSHENIPYENLYRKSQSLRHFIK